MLSEFVHGHRITPPTGALAALTSANSRKLMMDFVPDGPLEHIYLSTPEVGGAGAIFKLRLRGI